jgi:hypothetical protein
LNNSAHDLIAFAIVECNVSVELEFFQNLSPTDPLYKAILNAWKEKQRRDDARTALICAVIANCNSDGKKKYEVKDFMPSVPKTTEESEREIKSNFMRFKSINKS